MGSNMYTDEIVSNCNGAHAHVQQPGVIMSGNLIGKEHQQLPHFHSIVMVEESELSPLQNSTTTSSSTSSPPSSSPGLQCPNNSTTQRNDVTQVGDDGTVNGGLKNCSSMDHHHPAGARNITRAEPHVPDQPQQLINPQHLVNPLHQHPLLPQQILHPHHQPYPPPPSLHPSLLGSGAAMSLVEGGYHLDGPMFRTPVVGVPVVGMGIPSHYQHPLPTPSEAVGSLDTSPPSSFSEGGKGVGKRRPRKRPKNCGVCGDRAKSFHFGGLSCDSCKAFFRRSVQHDAHLAFRCAYDNCCDINISTRKSCQYCRFAKCLSIGMEKGWVMTEEERNALNQQRLEKKQSKTTATTTTQPAHQQQPLPSIAPPEATASSSTATSLPSPEPTYTFKGTTIPVAAASNEPAALAFQESEYVADVDKMLDYMTYDEQLEIKSVVETYLHAYKEMPFRVSLEEGRRDTLEIIEMFTTILRRFAYFAKLIPDFAALSKGDQGNLLRAAVLEMCLLRGAVCFDTENNRWPSSTMESLKDCPQLRVEDMQRLVSRELFEMHITFIFHMKRLRIDEPTAMLLIMTVLFSPERIAVEDKVTINQGQEKYLMLLKKYVNWKFGTTAGSRIYPQLLTKLSDLRQLNDFHTEFHLNLDRQEVNAIRKSLMELHLNPYPNWKIVPESQQNSPEESRTASPLIPAQSPLIEGNPSMPMVTQALIRSFTDRRIPALLENPYATFETDLGMIRQVQQTLGSLFPSSSLSAFTCANTQNNPPPQRHQSTDSASSSVHSFSQQDPMFSADKPACSQAASVTPRGYASSANSAEVHTLEFLQTSRSHEYPIPSLSDSITKSSSTHLEGSLTTLLPGEYHSERLQQFFQYRTGSGIETPGVIRGLGASATSSSSATQLSSSSSLSSLAHISGSQLPSAAPTSVLRRHSSSRPSLPAAPSSVIKSAPPSAKSSMQSSSSSLISSGVGVIHQLSDDSLGHGNIIQVDAQEPFRPITGSVSGGWHGGEVHTTTNGYRPPIPAPSAITVTSRIQSTSFCSGDADESSVKKNN